VTLIEDHEFQLLAVENLEQEVRALGMEWWHLPIRDVDVPDQRFEDAWVLTGARLPHASQSWFHSWPFR
jgi:ADP-ribosyl-[dinitrogen reductase] hydrolase